MDRHARDSAIWFWGLLGYLASLIDDNPLNADTILGTGFGFYAMELMLRSLTIACFYLALREATDQQKTSWKALLLMAVAFIWTSADDLRYLLGLSFFIGSPWEYPAIFVLQSASLVFFLLAIHSAKSSIR